METKNAKQEEGYHLGAPFWNISYEAENKLLGQNEGEHICISYLVQENNSSVWKLIGKRKHFPQ